MLIYYTRILVLSVLVATRCSGDIIEVESIVNDRVETLQASDSFEKVGLSRILFPSEPSILDHGK
jgi:hypothetical protein